MKNFHLALWAMADMESHAGVVQLKPAFIVATGIFFQRNARHGMTFKFQNIRLNIMQKVVRRNVDKRIQFLTVFQLRKQINVITPQLAPRGQHRVAHILFAIAVK